MKWSPLPSEYPEMRVWGSHRGEFSYVISLDRKPDLGEYTDRYAVSAAPLGKMPWVPGRIDLGVYDTFVQAEQACMRHSRKVQQ